MPVERLNLGRLRPRSSVKSTRLSNERGGRVEMLVRNPHGTRPCRNHCYFRRARLRKIRKYTYHTSHTSHLTLRTGRALQYFGARRFLRFYARFHAHLAVRCKDYEILKRRVGMRPTAGYAPTLTILNSALRFLHCHASVLVLSLVHRVVVAQHWDHCRSSMRVSAETLHWLYLVRMYMLHTVSSSIHNN